MREHRKAALIAGSNGCLGRALAGRPSGGSIDSVIRLAACYDTTGNDHPLCREVTVEGTRRLLRALRDGEAGQFVFASTLIVHAPAEPGVKIDEDHPIRPGSAYLQSKADTEAVVAVERGAIPAVVLRPAGIDTEDCRAAFIAERIGMLLITFAVIIAPQPGIARDARATVGDRPLGRSYSPSSFAQRAPTVVLAFRRPVHLPQSFGYQLGHIDRVRDPFFAPVEGGGENGSASVITSALSEAFPFPDAGLGAVACILDIVTGAAGDRRRWRTMPWLVLLFGLPIVPLGAVSLIFIIVQPTTVAAVAMGLLPAAFSLPRGKRSDENYGDRNHLIV